MKPNNKLKRFLLCIGITFLSVFTSAFVTAQDQCDTTQQCRVKFGSSATDCRDSRSNSSICICGSERCDIQASPKLPSFYFDFGTSDSPRQVGYLRVTSSSLTGTARWIDGSSLRSLDREKNTHLNRDIIYSRYARTFRVRVPNGSYRVTVTLGDTYSHDNMVIKAQGEIKASDIDRRANEWRNETFSVDVSDGNLDLEFSDAGGSDRNWVVNAVVIEGTSSTAPTPKPTPEPISTPLPESEYTIISIEAESVSPVGYWRSHSYFETTPATEIRRTGLIFDPPNSFLSGPQSNQTLVYNFKTKEAGVYNLALFMARDTTRFSKEDPGGSGAWGDPRNNDVYFKISESQSKKVVHGPMRLFFGSRRDLNDRLVWGNMYDPTNGGKEGWKNSSIVKHALKANTEYKLEVTGRGDGVILDRISIKTTANQRNTERHRAPVGERIPQLPKVSIKTSDLSQYHAMQEWSKAGVERGIPKNLKIKKTINPGNNIQAAIDEVANGGGGVVLLKNGIYKLSGTSGIKMKSKVVLRGESRAGVRIESRLTKGPSILFDRVEYAGVENLTHQFYFGNSDPRHDWYGNPDNNKSKIDSFHMTINSKNNWIKDCNIINSGNHPITLSGSHHTATGNYIDGAYNKGGGGSGYYNIWKGSYMLVKNENIRNLRHLGILMQNTFYNVVVDNFIATDINFHLGDVGHNLIEGNSIHLPKHHGWGVVSTGLPRFKHMGPGDGNIIVNNLTRHDKYNTSEYSQENLVYTMEGYGGPVPTKIKVPKEGRFYVPAWGDEVQKQISFVNPTPRDNAILGVGSNLEVTVEGQGDIQSIALYRDNTFVREELQEPYEWSGNKDVLLQNLAEGKYEFRAEATFADGMRANKSFMVTIGDSTQLSKRIQAEDFDAQSGIQNVLGKKVGYVNNGDWIRFNGLSIAQASSFSVNVATPTQGGTIEIRSGSLQGPLLGSVDVSNTFGWDKFVSLQTNVASVYTSTDIFFVFKGSGNGYLFDIDYFQFD
ncbi:carbohydrate-binding protein [Agarilytica rhodophyticola]|uniref:carbohydrate-binding protein n=1 Tax=Agarilytica rhodophyticola TaxID=1737490 RepID=UPI000CD81A40|nr:carbohydrate-binding protein [Agarilytica rhodophyticola]